MSSYFVFASALPVADFERYSEAVSCDEFLNMAAEYLSAEDVRRLKSVSLDAVCAPEKEFEAGDQPFAVPADPVAVFYMWDTQLRNELAIRRGGGRTGFLPKYVAAMDASVAQEAVRCFDAANPWEKARAIDRLRWLKLEELSANHYGDREYIFLYYLKIQLLAKWAERTSERGKENFEKAVDEIYAACSGNLKKE